VTGVLVKAKICLISAVVATSYFDPLTKLHKLINIDIVNNLISCLLVFVEVIEDEFPSSLHQFRIKAISGKSRWNLKSTILFFMQLQFFAGS
jgi:hypothetical protein